MLLSFSKETFSKTLCNSLKTQEQVKQFHNTPVPPNIGPVMKSPASKPHGLRDKNTGEKSARKRSLRKPHTH